MARAEAHLGSPAPGSTQAVYYRHRDASGKVTVVDSLDKLPAEVRVEAERVVLTGAPADSADIRAPGERATLPTLPLGLDATSFALGLGAGMLGAALVGLMLGRLAPGAVRWVARGALLAGLALLIAGGYLGWLRRAAGLGDATLASPRQLVEDARNAADRVRQQRAAQQRELDEIRRLAQ
jgi:hypothetical protein